MNDNSEDLPGRHGENYIWMAIYQEARELATKFVKMFDEQIELDSNQPLIKQDNFEELPDGVIELTEKLLSPDISNVEVCNFILETLGLDLETFYLSMGKDVTDIKQSEERIKNSLISKVRPLFLDKDAIKFRRGIINKRKIDMHFGQYRAENKRKLIEMNKKDAFILAEDAKAGIEFAILNIQDTEGSFQFDNIVAQAKTGTPQYYQELRLNTYYITKFILAVKHLRENPSDLAQAEVTLQDVIEVINRQIPEKIIESRETESIEKLKWLIGQLIMRFKNNQIPGHPEYSELYQKLVAAYSEEYKRRMSMKSRRQDPEEN